MKWAIVDLDGTVSDCRWRANYAAEAKREPSPELRNNLWRGFHSRCTEDAPIDSVVEIVKAWVRAGHGVIYITGRGAEWGRETLTWLRRNGLPANAAHLFMRGDADYRTSADYKLEMYNRIVNSPTWRTQSNEITFVLEDADSLVAMWRGLGLLCLQVTL